MYQSQIMSKKAFNLIELTAVVVLLTLLSTGAIIGLRKQREAVNSSKLLQCLDAIDQAKQTWRVFNPQATWPDNEAQRWQELQTFLKADASIKPPVATDDYNKYTGFLPDAKYSIWIRGVNEPCRAKKGIYIILARPL